jgi:hypothetical protein
MEEQVVRKDWDKENNHQIFVCLPCEKQKKKVRLNSIQDVRRHFRSKHGLP